VAASGRRNADDRLAVELAAGKIVGEAARVARLSERTAYRRLDDPKFRRRVTTLRSEMIGRATGRLADASSKAVDTLAALLKADSESVRLGAARSILEMGAKFRESAELEQRIAELENRTYETRIAD